MAVVMKPLKPWELRQVLFHIGAAADHSLEVRDRKIGMLLTDLLQVDGAWSRDAVVALLRGTHGQANAESALRAMTDGCLLYVPLAKQEKSDRRAFAHWCLHFGRVDVLSAVVDTVVEMGLKFPQKAGTGATTDAGDALDNMACTFRAAEPGAPADVHTDNRTDNQAGDRTDDAAPRRWSFVAEVGFGPEYTTAAWPAEVLDACAELIARVDPDHADFRAEVAAGTELGARFALAAMTQKMSLAKPLAQLPASPSTTPVPGGSRGRRTVGA